jgi:hypothetical protein
MPPFKKNGEPLLTGLAHIESPCVFDVFMILLSAIFFCVSSGGTDKFQRGNYKKAGGSNNSGALGAYIHDG